MGHRRFLVTLCGLITLLLLAPAQPAHAAPIRGDEVILGDDLTLQEGEHIDGDLVMIGGDLTMRAGSRVAGSVTVLGGRVRVNGTVEGDLVAMGGGLSLDTQARVQGDTVALGGRVHQAQGAQTGDVIKGPEIQDLRFWRDLSPPFSPPIITPRPGSIAGWTVTTLGVALVLALLGVAIVSFWPAQTAQVGETLLAAPVPSLGIGCLIYPLAASLVIFILLTICLSPFAPVVMVTVVAAGLFGWVALGRLFGRWLARTTGWRSPAPLALTAAGVFALTIVAAILGVIPCLGFLLVLGASSIGLGAVALTRFGARPYPRRAAQSPTGLEPTGNTQEI